MIIVETNGRRFVCVAVIGPFVGELLASCGLVSCLSAGVYFPLPGAAGSVGLLSLLS